MPPDVSGPNAWPILCPACRAAILDEQGRCPGCSATFAESDGVWKLLDERRRAALAPFLGSYSRIRLAEGRGAAQASELAALPECPHNHPLQHQWRIRARSFRVLDSLLSRELARGSRVLDLGAGCGWLSHRLAVRGLRPCAIDFNLDTQDGLRASRHYSLRFPCLEAEFDALPLPSAFADAAIFNASLHYSTDVERTLREVLRVLKAGGLVAVVDSPIYHDAGSGRKMVVEQHEDFERRFGDRSDHLASIGFLTWNGLDQLARDLGLRWNTERPWYGWRWAARPLIARLRGRREPAAFAVLHARKPQAAAS